MRPSFTAVALGLATFTLNTAALAADSAAPSAKPAAASRPASEIVLVRVGDTVITQEDFNQACSLIPPARVANAKASIVRGLIGQRLLSLYLDEHPELVDKAKLEAKIKEALEKEGVKTPEEMEQKMKAQGTPGKLEYFTYRARNLLGREEIVRRVEKNSGNDEFLKQLYEKEKPSFDGTRMFVREIRIDTLPWETPEQLQAKRDRAERIREDLVAGRRTWEQCLTESDSPSKMVGGDMGYVPRHLEQPEVVAEAAFELQVGETSKVLEDRTGFYIIQVTKRHQGGTTFEQAKNHMKLWLQWEPLQQIDREMRAKHKVVGVREPDMPPPPASMPAPPGVGRPGAASRPAAMPHRPATRPARPPAAGRKPPVKAPTSPARPATAPSH